MLRPFMFGFVLTGDNNIVKHAKARYVLACHNLIRRMTMADETEELTCSIPEAGAMAGLGRNGSYDAARRNEIPTISFGKLKRVPLKKWKRILSGEETRG